jgi:signal transduction histidine kinase/DNA-binding NarL/FixJ family response regulator
MLIPGTQMHIITFIFVSIEIVIFFYLLIYKLARPDDKTTFLNVVLIFLLITYNVTGGLLPDPNLPGSIFIQEVIAYGTGFITPCYFPYYVYKAFGLEKMKFHAYRGVFLCLLLPYFLFVIVYAATNNREIAKNLLILPVLYALWIIYSLLKAIKYKYRNNFSSKESKEEVTVLFFSITPWIGLPVVAYFNLSQAVEASITNPGFLLLLALQVNRHIKQLRTEHQRLIDSEFRLSNWNMKLQEEVNKRTRALEKINEQRTNTFVNLAHETKTPLTLINNYLEEYISKNESSEELSIVKRNLDKLSTDIVNLFDLEKFNKGFAVYNHDLLTDFSESVKNSTILFKQYVSNRNIELTSSVEENIFVKADPLSINRVINNLVENAIKFSIDGGAIAIKLKRDNNKIIFSVKDNGVGIPSDLHKKVFDPYYQMANQKKSIQGMGLGLPIVKKVIDELHGQIKIVSNPQKFFGTEVTVVLNIHVISEDQLVSANTLKNIGTIVSDYIVIQDSIYNENKQTILIAENNKTMLNYLLGKLGERYNVYAGLNGNEALRKLKNISVIPDLIISDVMMDKLDGFAFAKIISNDPLYNYIPFIFLTAKDTHNDKIQGLKLGAIDYIKKPFSITELLQKVESVLATAVKHKKAVLSMAFNTLNVKDTLPLKNGNDAFEQNCRIYQLTVRETEIAKLICQGQKYKGIGETVFIAERTVTKHAQNIFEKVEVSNKIELINKLEYTGSD